MRRELINFTENEFDLCVIGGGIYGACAVWDAALRGLSVALIEKDDFGHATSFNSQNTIHGGFRYLQNLEIKRIRDSVQERRTWMNIAPHLIHPLPFLIPTYRNFGKPKELFYLAMKAYDLLSFDKNKLLDPQKHIPKARFVSVQECRRLFPEIDQTEITGGALFYDALVHNSERLGLAFLRSAVDAGAVIANYAEAYGFIQKNGCITGVKVRDHLKNNEFVLKAKVVLNMAGPWVNRVIDSVKERLPEPVEFLKVMYLAVNRPVPKCAIGLLGYKGKYYFMLPWHGHSLIGIAELACEERDLDRLNIREQDIESFITDINCARPSVKLKREDIVTVRGGLLPADKLSMGNTPKLTTKAKIIDHSKYGINGLISVIGIKLTMSRRVAQEIIDLVFKKIGYKSPPCTTHEVKIYGGNIEQFESHISNAFALNNNILSEQSIRHLVLNYGSAYTEITKYMKDNSEFSESLSEKSQVLKAEIRHAVLEEMAQKLVDVIFRRTELGILGYPGESALIESAKIMAQEMRWNQARIEKELEEVRSAFSSSVLGIVQKNSI